MDLENTLESLQELGVVSVTFARVQRGPSDVPKPMVSAEQHVGDQNSRTVVQHQCVAATYAGAAAQLLDKAKRIAEIKSNIIKLS